MERGRGWCCARVSHFLAVPRRAVSSEWTPSGRAVPCRAMGGPVRKVREGGKGRGIRLIKLGGA